MIHSLFPHRRSSLREARLLGRNFDAAPEVQKAKELMQNPRAKLAELQDVITKGLQTQKESGEFIDTLARELNRENNEEVLRNLDELTKDTTDTSLGALRSTIHQLKERMNTVPPSAQQPVNVLNATLESEPKTLVEKTGDALKRGVNGLGNAAEVITNTVLPTAWTKEMSREKKIAIGAAMTVGVGVLLVGLFRRIKRSFGQAKEVANQSSGGFLKKWGIRLGIGLALLFGAKMLADRFFPGSIQAAAKGAAEIGSGAAKGIEKGSSRVAENFRESFSFKKREDFKTDAEYHTYLANELKEKGNIPLDRKNFKSDEEYAKALEGMLEEYQKVGGNWAIVGNSIVFLTKNGWDAACQIASLPSAAYNLVTNSDNIEKWRDAAVVYGEGFILYASSFAILDTAFWTTVAGPKAGLMQGAKNAAGWPVSILNKGYRMAGMLLPGKTQSLNLIQAKAAGKGIQYTLNRFRPRELNPFGKWTVEQVDDLFDEWRSWRNIDFDLEKYHASQSLIGHHQKTLLGKLERGVTELINKQGLMPSFLQNPEAEALIHQIKAGQINSQHFEETLEKLYSTSTKKKPAINPKSKAAKASASATTTVEDPFANQIDDAVERMKTSELLDEIDELSPEARAAILADDTATDVIKGAIVSGDVAEKSRVQRMIRGALKYRTAVAGGGMALSGFGLLMTYADFKENGEKAAKTTNPELKKIYSESNAMIAVDAGVQIVGLVVDGIVLAETVSGTVICSAAAPAGIVLLPVTALVMGTREAYNQLADLREYFVKTEKDLLKTPAHQILAHIEKSAPMQNTNTMQWILSSISTADSKTQMDANLNARITGYRAYFAQSAQNLIPYPTTADVYAMRNIEGDISQDDVKNLYRDWISQYVLEAEGSIRVMTNSQFYLVDADTLNSVRQEAYAKWLNGRWGEKKNSRGTYNRLNIEMAWQNDIIAAASDPDTFVYALPSYIVQKTGVVDALAFAEREIAASTTMSEKEKQTARAQLLYDMRKQMQEYSSRVDQNHKTSEREIQSLVVNLKQSAEKVWYYRNPNKDAPVTTMLKDLLNTPIVLNAQTLESFIQKYPLRQIQVKQKREDQPQQYQPKSSDRYEA